MFLAYTRIVDFHFPLLVANMAQHSLVATFVLKLYSLHLMRIYHFFVLVMKYTILVPHVYHGFKTYNYDTFQPDMYPSSSFQNLKKLKRSVSGALGRNKTDVAVSSLDENWLLSRSVPNLLNNSYPHRWSDTSPSSGDQV